MHHICHVTWDCMLCNVKCIATRSLDRSPVRLCSSFRSSIFPVLIVTDRAILQSATVVLLQIAFIFSFHLLHFQSARLVFSLKMLPFFVFLFVFYIFSRQVVSNIFERRIPLFVFNDSLKPFVILIRKMKFLSKFLPGFFYLGI